MNYCGKCFKMTFLFLWKYLIFTLDSESLDKEFVLYFSIFFPFVLPYCPAQIFVVHDTTWPRFFRSSRTYIFRKKQQLWIYQSQVLKLKLWLKNFQQTKVQDQMASQANSIKHLKKSWHLSFWNSSENLQRKEHSQAHSMRPPSPAYQNHTKIPHKQKIQANITDEHRCKIPQQNTSKQNPTTH